jgi:hypothetical protein
MIRAAGSTSDDEGPKPSAHRFRLLRYGPDRRELIGGQRLLGKQQAAAFVESIACSGRGLHRSDSYRNCVPGQRLPASCLTRPLPVSMIMPSMNLVVRSPEPLAPKPPVDAHSQRPRVLWVRRFRDIIRTMADRFARHRSRIMVAVRSKGTAPELKARQFAHQLGFCFRLPRGDLPGRPDLVKIAQ